MKNIEKKWLLLFFLNIKFAQLLWVNNDNFTVNRSNNSNGFSTLIYFNFWQYKKIKMKIMEVLEFKAYFFSLNILNVSSILE